MKACLNTALYRKGKTWYVEIPFSRGNVGSVACKSKKAGLRLVATLHDCVR